MNLDHETPPDTAPLPHKKMSSIGSYIATAAMFLVVVFLWRDLARTKDVQLDLTEQNDRLRKEISTTQDELDSFKRGDFETRVKKENTEAVPAKPKPVEEPETLRLQTPSISQTATGLVTRLTFQSTLPSPPALIAIVVRLPGDSEAIIQSFSPVNKSAYTNVKARVDGSGKFAIFQGNPTALNALQFDLAISEPVTATVRGSKGIKAFEIDIAPDASKVRKL